MHALNAGRNAGTGLQQSEMPAWGDLGNGLYKNPVLNADYSDPDIVRVGKDFYMVCSDFHYMGMPVLHSRDLVNWTIIAHVYRRLDISPRYDAMEGYGKGSWAPSIRFHAGLFYVYFCTPDEGLFMSSAKDPAGPWSPLHEVRRTHGWEDPCPFWDDDGRAYLGHSTLGAGPIFIHEMSPDGKTLLDEGRVVYVGKIAEGTKIYKRNGWYYLVIPEGGVDTGWQTVARSRHIYGPYERRVVLETGRGTVNGPHQGGLIELESGESWFMHFQSAGSLGRVCHLQPVSWVDDWPLMGVSGEPVSIYAKPDVGSGFERMLPQTSDSFAGPGLGLQWQWNHNPVDEAWSLTERPGRLRLHCLKLVDAAPMRLSSGVVIPAPPYPSVFTARNTLTQKIMGRRGTATVRIDWSGLGEDAQAGLCLLGGGTSENRIGLHVREGLLRIEAHTAGKVFHGPALRVRDKKHPAELWLKLILNLEGESVFSFSFDGHTFIPIGGECDPKDGFWKGAKIGLYSFRSGGRAEGDISVPALESWADFTDFVYTHDGMPTAT